jgi:membrane protease YdiL (CAAX protease family)
MMEKGAESPKGGAALHGGLFLLSLLLVTVAAPGLPWPLYLLVPLLIYAAIAASLPALRRTAPRLRFGRATGKPLVFAIALAAATIAALVGFHVPVRPDVSELTERLPAAWFGNLIAAGVFFSLVNATLEELIYRGVLWSVIAEEWNNGVALVATASLFGWSHWHGYPPGPLGAVLAGLFGMALGILRWQTGGLGLCVACHVCADATIFCLLAVPA